MFTRDDLVVLAQLDQDARGVSFGSAGMMTENGLAYLMWNESGIYLKSAGCIVRWKWANRHYTSLV